MVEAVLSGNGNNIIIIAIAGPGANNIIIIIML